METSKILSDADKHLVETMKDGEGKLQIALENQFKIIEENWKVNLDHLEETIINQSKREVAALASEIISGFLINRQKSLNGYTNEELL